MTDIVKFFFALHVLSKMLKFCEKRREKESFYSGKKVHSTVMGLCEGIDFIKKKIVGKGEMAKLTDPENDLKWLRMLPGC